MVRDIPADLPDVVTEFDTTIVTDATKIRQRLLLGERFLDNELLDLDFVYHLLSLFVCFCLSFLAYRALFNLSYTKL